MHALFSPLARAIGQMDDRIFLGVLLRSLVWSVACFAALHVFAVWVVGRLLDLHGLLGWAAGVLATIGATLLTLWLFLPVAAAIGTIYIDRVAAAVERRYYPFLPPARGAPLAMQVWDGISLGGRVLALTLLSIVLALLLPGIGALLAWPIAAYAIGRGLFMAVAMRRMPRPAAELIYRQTRLPVLGQGGIMAAAAMLPVLNLFIPILGTAAMVHVLDQALAEPPPITRP